MTDWLKIIQECAQEMKKAAQKYYGSPEAAESFTVGAGGDHSKKIDLAAENALIDCLNKHEISCTLVSEEAGTKKIGKESSDYYVVTDPVDGTTNAVHGLPFCAHVIAVSKGSWLKNVETAIVSDIVHDITYTAQKNKGAFKNGKPINPSKVTNIEDAVIGVDLNTIKIEEFVSKLKGLFSCGKHFRHFGANAQEICYVADGSTDVFVDVRSKLRVTDMVASYLILQEAGGIIMTPDANELNVPLEATQRVSFVAAANMELYESVRKALCLC
ncbi:MAG: inositol monophosphatase family protein [Candidatus Bathyarchaeum tardum]|nr:MAG: inositol monophosphatase family protein [Candidatus Bathyarchaeum tardum]